MSQCVRCGCNTTGHSITTGLCAQCQVVGSITFAQSARGINDDSRPQRLADDVDELRLRRGASPSAPKSQLRDRFAGEALAGMLHSGFIPSQLRISFDEPDCYAKAAYKLADQMLKAREQHS